MARQNDIGLFNNAKKLFAKRATAKIEEFRICFLLWGFPQGEILDQCSIENDFPVGLLHDTPSVGNRPLWIVFRGEYSIRSAVYKRIFANPLTVHDPSAIDPIVPYLIFLLENRINFGSLLFWAFAHVDRTRIDSRIQSVVVFDSWELPGMPTFQTKNSRRKMHLEIGDALES